MSDSEQAESTRPTQCPFCKSRNIDTLAKVITVTTFWRCRGCEASWTMERLRTSARRG